MTRFTKANVFRFAAAFGLLAVVFSLGLSPVLALPKKDTETKVPTKKDPPPPPPPVNPDLWTGPFNGNVGVVLMQKNVPGPNGNKTTPQTVKTFNMKDGLALAWNSNRLSTANTIKDFMSVSKNVGRRLYSIKVNLGQATDATKLSATVNSKTKTVTLNYIVTGNQIDCEADVNNLPDPSVRIKFDLRLTVVIATTGTANDPIVVKSATVAILNSKVTIDGNLIFDAVQAVAEFFKGTDFARNVERAVNGKSSDVTAKLSTQMSVVNVLMRPYTVERGFRVVTPRYDRAAARLNLELSQPPLVLQQNLQRAK